jgi:cytidylate kinase
LPSSPPMRTGPEVDRKLDERMVEIARNRDDVMLE